MPAGVAIPLAVVLAGVVGACVGLWLALKARARLAVARRGRAQEIERIRATAEREAMTLRRQVEVVAREEALVLRNEAEPLLRGSQVELAELEAALVGRKVFLDEEARTLADLRKELSDRELPLKELERDKQAADAERVKLVKQQRGALERAAGASAAEVLRSLVDAEIEDARELAAQAVRNASEGESATEVARGAKRLMGISGGRLSERFYSERVQSVIALPESRGERAGITVDDLKAIEGVAGVTLTFTDEGDGIRLEGLDGVGREMARRCVARMLRKPGLRGEVFAKVAREITTELEREIVERGQRGFALLKLERAHPEIVKLVGRLNFRTSYSQNQWEHAVESGFLCGMIAGELGLNVKIARRAALLHDIGKALTHELDGSHAVIGADYARRLGETELVANAIGAHHTDEPFASAYAHLVAAADAMSGGRPGSRRQNEDNHMAKLAEIERIARSFRGVGEAFAVQGGREVRIYVEEDRIDDAGAAKLATDIAGVISREMTFPGQIKVTVIREFNAVEMAS
jgi:ribonuclease Y